MRTTVAALKPAASSSTIRPREPQSPRPFQALEVVAADAHRLHVRVRLEHQRRRPAKCSSSSSVSRPYSRPNGGATPHSQSPNTSANSRPVASRTGPPSACASAFRSTLLRGRQHRQQPARRAAQQDALADLAAGDVQVLGPLLGRERRRVQQESHRITRSSARKSAMRMRTSPAVTSRWLRPRRHRRPATITAEGLSLQAQVVYSLRIDGERRPRRGSCGWRRL